MQDIPFHPTLPITYGFDDVAILPGERTLDPGDVDLSTEVGGVRLDLPVLASAMDSAVGPAFAGRIGEAGGLAVLNLQGLQTKYEDPEEPISEIIAASNDEAVATIQRLYAEPVKDHLVAARIAEIRALGVPAAVSSTPAAAKALGPVAAEAGADLFFLQSTVVSTRHEGAGALDVGSFISGLGIPVVVGNCVTGDVALALMEAGAAGILVGIGPGAACTTRAVTGVGVGQVTATISCAGARDEYERTTGRRVAIVTDGGMRKGGEIAKAIASGADAVMLGSVFSGLEEAPGRGYHWGMATSDPNLPRGTRVAVKSMVTLETLFHGPSARDDGTLNLLGGLANSMGMVGAASVREMQEALVVQCTALRTEGKHYQFAEGVGQAR